MTWKIAAAPIKGAIRINKRRLKKIHSILNKL